MQNFSRYIFFTLVVLLIGSFFVSRNIRTIDFIVPESIKGPIQTTLNNNQPISFTKDNYEYQLTPLYDYVLNGMVVSKINYGFFGIYQTDKLFPVDVCMIWGSNLESGTYKSRSLKFSQDCRWCWAEWYGDVRFNLQEMSNNHLLVNNRDVERKLKHLSPGDQVSITGKLVNVHAKLIGKAGAFDPSVLQWNTSVTRSDSGAGACEVIYVEDVESIQKAHPWAHRAFSLAFYGLIVWFVIKLKLFFTN